MILLDQFESTRQLLISFAPFFKGISLFLSLSLFAASISNKFRKYGKYIIYSSFMFYLSCFIFISIFHYQIYKSVQLLIPQAGINVRLAAPLWIESEKLFFWLLLFLFFSSIFIKVIEHSGLYAPFFAISGIFLAIVSFYNPFHNPLPQLTSEIYAINSAFQNFEYGKVMKFFGRIKYYYNTVYMWTHPPLLFLSYALFTLSLPGLIYSLFTNRKKRIIYEYNAYTFIKLGYIFLSAGMLIGFPWAVQAWHGQAWWWSPKINVSIMMWLFYSAYLHGRLYLGKKYVGRFTILLGILSFLSLIFTYATTYLIPGVHSYV